MTNLTAFAKNAQLGGYDAMRQLQTTPTPASTPAPPHVDPLPSQGSQDAGNVIKTLLLALGIGAAGRGLVGGYNMIDRKLHPRKPKYPGAVMTAMPYESDEPVEKTAEPGATWPQILHGALYGTAVTAAGMGGAYGGWKGIDAILDRRRKGEDDDEVEEAREEFNKALLDTTRKPKMAADASPGEKLGAALDELYDVWEKRADLKDWLAQLAGGYGMYAVGTGSIAGMLTYDHFNKQSKRKALEAAMALRQKRDYLAHPSQIMAVPEPVPAGVAPADLNDTGE